MYTGQSSGQMGEEATESNEVQSLVLQRLWEAVKAFGSKQKGLLMSGSEALRELRAMAPQYHDSSGCTAVPMEANQLSLPEPGGSPMPLEQLLDAGSLTPPSEFSALVLPKMVAEQQKLERGVGKVYHDPRLRDVNVYADVLARLEDSGVIEFVREESVERVGLSSVTKKQNKQRLIIDCRASNCHFVDPPYTSLPTGDVLSSITIPD
eukprot:6469061-Amphidinium_carterae.1